MILLMQSLNEEEYVQRVMEHVSESEVFDRLILIDGGSTDYTVQAVRETCKIPYQVFVHPWLDWYHDMNVAQRNIGLSYVPHGETFFILDFDERMSDPLVQFLASDEGQRPRSVLTYVSRKTVNVMRYPDSPIAIMDDDGWPIHMEQIGQYPDYQPRLIIKTNTSRWINSPHHVLIGYVSESHQNSDIIHYEKNDARQRERIEKKWAREMATRKKLGLSPDRFEARVKPEIAKYADPETWDGTLGVWGE